MPSEANTVSNEEVNLVSRLGRVSGIGQAVNCRAGLRKICNSTLRNRPCVLSLLVCYLVMLYPPYHASILVRPNHQALPCCLHHFRCHHLHLIYLQYPFDLCPQPL